MPPSISVTTIRGGAQSGSGARSRHDRSDGRASPVARVQLKLAALAYVNTCVGSSPSQELALASVASLCGAAIRYFAALTSAVSLSVHPEDAPAAAARLNLQLSATAYASTRHGVDACMEFTRVSIAGLCDAAIHYAELITRSDVGVVVDRSIGLDDGR